MIVVIDPEVRSDGITVWVDGMSGCIGRFGKNGIDIHTEDTTGCLLCTHEPTTAADWERFRLGMLTHHGVVVSEEHKPVRFQ